ncbi:MAG: DNRLRE domain-containing protein, partial [Anaerolineae bacterium]|nr:DNRLRE domain-containing protein [Anaerolineae bacterium]
VILAGLVWALLDGGATGPLPAPSPTAAPLATPVKDAQAVSRLDIADPARIDDTWLNPDLPEGTWADLDLVHLQGPLTPDRTLVRFDLAGIPEDAEIVSATLTLRAELWGDEVFPGAVVVYTVLTPWDPTTATYQTPWTAPGLAAGVDYDSTPLDIRPIAETGPLVFNVTKALHAWIEERRPNQGFVIMMSEDSHNMAHWWLYLSEQPEAAARPTLRVSYRSHE